MFVALIPARGGSKGIPRKNLAKLNGRPLIAYTIEAARASSHIASVYVSSDDDEILSVAADMGCHALRRPNEFATDEATANDVVRHFIDQILPSQEKAWIVYLQPTSPLRTAGHIDAAIQAITGADETSLVSVRELDVSPFKSFVLDENGRLKSLFDEKLSNMSRQQLPVAYVPNGAIYIFSKDEFLTRGGFPSNGGLPFVMSESESVDIDDLNDMDAATCLLEHRHG